MPPLSPEYSDMQSILMIDWVDSERLDIFIVELFYFPHDFHVIFMLRGFAKPKAMWICSF